MTPVHQPLMTEVGLRVRGIVMDAVRFVVSQGLVAASRSWPAPLERDEMGFVVVPDYISNEIDRRLDGEIAKHPDAGKDRSELRRQLIDFVDQHGFVPDFSLGKKKEQD